MLPPSLTASVLATGLTMFVAVNLYNLKKSSLSKKEGGFGAEVDHPAGLSLVSAALGTGTFFLETVLYVLLVALGLSGIVTHSPLQLRFLYEGGVQLIGLVVTIAGYALFGWSVLARGAYATSWEMPPSQRLVTWGPYRYVRHPA